MSKKTLMFLIFILTAILAVLVFAKQQSVLSVSDSRTSVFEHLLPVFNSYQKNKRFKEYTETLTTKSGNYGVYVLDLSSNQKYTFNETDLFYGASLFKVPIAVSVLNEAENLDEEITYLPADYSDGTGSIGQSPYYTKFTINELLKKLLKESDNTAQEMLIQHFGYENLKSGFDLIELKNHFFENNTVTPEQYVSFLKNMNQPKLIELMSNTIFDDRIHQNLSQDLIFAHKIGNWPDTSTWHDCGIVYNDKKEVIVCLMSRNTTFNEFKIATRELGEFINFLYY